ncbi:DUF4115 domain-containing protein [candidate division KSB1 bacterium]|nr:DUF4115 domain-containing protein [candidate division KSB1 bacterium]
MSVERLREILLEGDRARMRTLEHELDEVRTTIADKEALLASLNPVIADLLERKIASSGEEMAEIVAPLMGPAIKKQVAESKDEMVEALYPVIGQTVRRAVAEAMRKLVKQINERLDKSFNLKITWLRLKARILGLPEPLVLLPQVFPFAIEQLFLIDQRTGLLIAHTALENAGATNGKAINDEPRNGESKNGEPVESELENSEPANGEPMNGKPQMVSGMLTAIQDFTKEAFGTNAEGDLHEVKYGDKMIFVASSPPVFLAAVAVGVAPPQFPEKLRGALRRIHNTFHAALREFDGDATPLEATREPMQKFMASFAETSVPKPASREKMAWPKSTFGKIALGIAIGLALAAGIWFMLKPSRVRETTPTPPIVATLAPGVLQLRVEARLSGEVWVRAVADERDSTDFTFQTGEVFVWHAANYLRLRVGNAGQTELYLNGKNLGPLGEVNQAVTLVITQDGIVERR